MRTVIVGENFKAVGKRIGGEQIGVIAESVPKRTLGSVHETLIRMKAETI
jgi:hypothetical protein